jgi:hypothetical protein
MTLELLSGAMTLAMLSTLLFMLIEGAWHTLNRAVSGPERLSDERRRRTDSKVVDGTLHPVQAQAVNPALA